MPSSEQNRSRGWCSIQPSHFDNAMRFIHQPVIKQRSIKRWNCSDTIFISSLTLAVVVVVMCNHSFTCTKEGLLNRSSPFWIHNQCRVVVACGIFFWTRSLSRLVRCYVLFLRLNVYYIFRIVHSQLSCCGDSDSWLWIDLSLDVGPAKGTLGHGVPWQLCCFPTLERKQIFASVTWAALWSAVLVFNG